MSERHLDGKPQASEKCLLCGERFPDLVSLAVHVQEHPNPPRLPAILGAAVLLLLTVCLVLVVFWTVTHLG